MNMFMFSELGTPAPFLPKFPGSSPWNSLIISIPDTESIDLKSIFVRPVSFLGKTVYSHSSSLQAGVCHNNIYPYPS